MTRDVVTNYHAALADRDFSAARQLLQDDLRFEGPFEKIDGAEAYIQTIQGLWNIVASVELRHLSTHADQAVVLFDMNTSTPAGSQLICEWYGVKDGRIAWIRAVFDTEPFAALRQARAAGA